MINTWAITSSGDKSRVAPSGLPLCMENDRFTIYAERKITDPAFDSTLPFVLVDGHVLPRLSSPSEINGTNDEEIVRNGYTAFGPSFINHIKGHFTILIATETGLMVFSDRLGLGKFFWSESVLGFVISNNLKTLSAFVRMEPDPLQIGMFALTHHSVGGKTLFSNVNQSGQATTLSYSETRLQSSSYWSIQSLTSLPLTKCSYHDYAQLFRDVIESSVSHFNPSKISLTLTGGYDSRLILSALLSLGVKPSTFTFGNPASRDVAIARQISKTFHLRHNNHFEPDPDREWFGGLASTILENGNSLVNYHRAFRLQGIMAEAGIEPVADLTIAGFLGGEGLRGAHYENLVIPDFVRHWNPLSEQSGDQIKAKLDERFVLHDDSTVGKLSEMLTSLEWFPDDAKMREFHHLFSLTVAHLSQDISLYHRFHKNLLTPFMDIDYLEFLFSTRFSMIYRDNASSSQLRRLDLPDLYCNVFKILSPALLKIPVTNGYTPSLYLVGKVPYLASRAFNKYFSPPKLPNFSYGNWFVKYLESEWPRLSSGPVAQYYDIARASGEIPAASGSLSEKQLHRFTSVIMQNDNFNRFINR